MHHRYATITRNELAATAATMFHVARRVVLARRPHGIRFCTAKKTRAVPKRVLVESGKSGFPAKFVGLGLVTGLGVVFYRGDILPSGTANARLSQYLACNFCRTGTCSR